jgi:two-component system cell cycle sensor histidine kinase/response regulator CckA
MDTALQPSAPTQASGDWALVVDDDQQLRDMLAEQLQAFGLGVATAEGGEVALQLMQTKASAPLLALIDVMMPGMDGLTLARRVMARYKQQTKVVIVSGHLADVSWWPVDLREVAFMPKPFRLAEIERVIAEARATRPQS